MVIKQENTWKKITQYYTDARKKIEESNINETWTRTLAAKSLQTFTSEEVNSLMLPGNRTNAYTVNSFFFIVLTCS